MAKIRVLLADDHVAMLARVQQQLGTEFDVVGTAKNGQEAIDATASLGPDVIVMDISMPVLDGLEAAARITNSGSKAKVIFLSVHEDTEFVAAAFLSGAWGYVTKARLATDLAQAINEACMGRSFVSPLNL